MSNLDKARQAIAKAPKMMTVYDFFDKQKDLIRKALPKAITPDRLIGLFTMVIKSSPEIMGCSQASLIAAVIQTIQFGLTPGAINHVYLVPFNNKKKDGSFVRECQLILGYRGMIELVNRSGKAAILSTECVYAADEFNYCFGLEPKLEHKPAAKDRGELIGVYCIAKNLIANEKVFVYLTKQEIDKVRAASKAGQSEYSPWAKWYEEMAKKTAVKRIYKLLPLSVDVQKQIAADETIKTEISPDMAEVKDETVWEEELLPEASPIAQIRQETPQGGTIKPQNGIDTAPHGSITEMQEKAIKDLAQKRYGKRWDIELLNRIGSDFGVETLSELSTENSAELIRQLSKEKTDA